MDRRANQPDGDLMISFRGDQLSIVIGALLR